MKSKFNEIRDFIVANPLLTITKIDLKEIRLIMERIEKILASLQINDKTKKKIYFVSIELLQNTFRHGKPEIDINFCISLNSDKVYILAENLIVPT